MLRAEGLQTQPAVDEDRADWDIRRARPSDLPTLLELEQHFPGDRLSRRSLRRLLLQAQADVLVYEHLGVVIADIVVLYRRNSPRARLYSLIVHPDHQGRGIAATLLRAAEQSAWRRGSDALSLEVRSDNAAALRLYQKCGFQPVRQIPGYYQDHSSALHMHKLIA